MDGGFHTLHTLRNEIRSYGYIESCAETSAVNEARAREEGAKWYPFENRPHFGTNGHREPNCECGDAKVSRDYDRRDDGNAVARVELLKENPSRWSKVDPSFILPDGTPEKELADLRLGNSLTFYDHRHIEYAQKRWGHNEGIHGAMSKTGLLFHGKNRFRSLAEVETATYQVLTYLHLRGIAYRLRSGAAANTLPLAA